METAYIAPGCAVSLGDCRELLARMPGGSADMALTDPPYGIGYRSNRRKDGAHRNRIAGDNDLGAVRAASRQLHRVLKPDSALFMFADRDRQGEVCEILRRAGFRIKNRIVWDKGNHTAGDCRGAFGFRYEILILAVKGRPLIRGERHDDIWRFPRVAGQKLVHQNEKPVALLERAIESMSDPGDLVIDPFLGSGSTGEACALAGRRFLGCEIDPRYYGPACERLRRAFAG